MSEYTVAAVFIFSLLLSGCDHYDVTVSKAMERVKERSEIVARNCLHFIIIRPVLNKRVVCVRGDSTILIFAVFEVSLHWLLQLCGKPDGYVCH
jgi:hypothetical protein